MNQPEDIRYRHGLTDKTPIRDFFSGTEELPNVCDQPVQLEFAFKYKPFKGFLWTLVGL